MDPKKNFFRKVLSNGMTIILEKRTLPIVSLAIAVKNGGINESLEEKGISHFIEHLLYKGTEKRPGSKIIAEEIEKNGGELNGFTGEDITAYWCKMPSKKLKIGLDVLADMVKNPLFDSKELEKERKVIFEEIKMRKDSPHVFVVDKAHEFLYENPFGKSMIGDEKTLNSIDRKKISSKFNEIYSPNNMILCVVGDCDFNKLVDFADKKFNGKKKEIPFFEIKLKNEEKIFERAGMDQANLVFAYHLPLASDKKSYAARVLGIVMAGGMSSRLFSEIREKRNLAYGIKEESDISLEFSYGLIYVGTTKENVSKVKNLILKEFKDVADNLTEKELEGVKEQIIGNHQISMEDSVGQMENLLHFERNGNASEYYDFEKNISSVKLKDVKVIAKSIFEKNSFVALIPKK